MEYETDAPLLKEMVTEALRLARVEFAATEKGTLTGSNVAVVPDVGP